MPLTCAPQYSAGYLSVVDPDVESDYPRLVIPDGTDDGLEVEMRTSPIIVSNVNANNGVNGTNEARGNEIVNGALNGVSKITLPPKICVGFRQLIAAMHEKITTWLNGGEKNTLFISLDGLSGSGKSSLTQAVEVIVSEMESPIKIFSVGVDDFINTDRESPLRELKNNDPQLFWALFTSRLAMFATVDSIARAHGAELQIDFERMYRRSEGRVVPGSLWVPEGRKIVFVDGVNSISVLNNLAHAEDFETLKVMLDVDPVTSMRRAIGRDVALGKNRKQIQGRRDGEYQHMIPQIAENYASADIIYQT